MGRWALEKQMSPQAISFKLRQSVQTGVLEHLWNAASWLLFFSTAVLGEVHQGSVQHSRRS